MIIFEICDMVFETFQKPALECNEEEGKGETIPKSLNIFNDNYELFKSCAYKDLLIHPIKGGKILLKCKYQA